MPLVMWMLEISLSLRCVSGTHNPRAPPPGVDDGNGPSASRDCSPEQWVGYGKCEGRGCREAASRPLAR